MQFNRVLFQQMHVFMLKLVIIIFSESYIIARGGRLLHARAQSYSSRVSTPSLKNHFSDTIQLLYGGTACKFLTVFLSHEPPETISANLFFLPSRGKGHCVSCNKISLPTTHYCIGNTTVAWWFSMCFCSSPLFFLIFHCCENDTTHITLHAV